MRPFLILQLRPEIEASDNEFEAILEKSGLTQADTHRVRLDCESLPTGLNLQDYSGVIVGGGPGCVSDAPEDKSPIEKRIEETVLALMPEVTDLDIPFLGCCYGIGILTHHLGGIVNKERYGESVGTSDCSLTEAGRDDPLMQGFPDDFQAFVGHKESAQALPPGCTHLAFSPTCPYQVIRYKQNVYATQFHPEADAQGFETRINIYQNHGYYPPEDAQKLIDMCHAANVHAPEKMLRNFVTRYGKP